MVPAGPGQNLWWPWADPAPAKESFLGSFLNRFDSRRGLVRNQNAIMRRSRAVSFHNFQRSLRWCSPLSAESLKLWQSQCKKIRWHERLGANKAFANLYDLEFVAQSQQLRVPHAPDLMPLRARAVYAASPMLNNSDSSPW